MSLQAYQRAAEQAEGPKQTEYRLFGLVTRALMDAVPDPSRRRYAIGDRVGRRLA